MKEKKTPLLILGGITLVLVTVCALMLTNVISLPARAPVGDGLEDLAVDLGLKEAAKEVYSKSKSLEEQVDNYFVGLKTRNPELLLGLYHPLYWESAGQSVAEALEMMQDNVNELEFPGDLTWRIVSQQPPEQQGREMILGTYESYGLEQPIEDMLTLEIETKTAASGAEETNAIRCSFLRIDGSWYLFDDIFQMHY